MFNTQSVHVTLTILTCSYFCISFWHACCIWLALLLQESSLKRLAFARKQRAIRDAVRIGDQIIRRNRRMLLASTFNAWKVRTGVYRQVARRFQASLEVTLRWAWTQWRAQLATQVLVYHSTSCEASKIFTLSHFMR